MPPFQSIWARGVWVLAGSILMLTAGKTWGAAHGTHLSASNVPMASDYATTVLIEGLEHPWGMAWLPGDRMLITERPGRLRVVQAGVLQPEPIRGLPAIFASGQAGLLDVTIDPDFPDNNRVYVSYAHGSRGTSIIK